MNSKKKVAANRANSQKSTGPKTDVGKLKSSQNAIKHGLYSDNVLLSDENRESYEQFHAQLIADQSPHTAGELILIEQVLTSYFLSRRAVTALTTCTRGGEAHATDIAAHYAAPMKMKNSCDRTVQRVLEQLRQFTRDRQTAPPGEEAAPLLEDPAIVNKWHGLPDGGFVSSVLEDDRPAPRGTSLDYANREPEPS